MEKATSSIFYSIVMIFFMTSCNSDKPGQGGLAFIDAKKDYPEKEVFLTDIADVTYLHLSTADDDFLYQGIIECKTENTIVVVDNASNSILFFSKDGNPKSRFNRRGQGPEEYLNIFDLVYDEAADEVFVVSARRKTIQVYSSTGIHKREIPLPEIEGMNIIDLIDFDDHSLFFYDHTVERNRGRALLMGENVPVADKYVIPFYRISKTTGEILDYIELPGTHLSLGINADGRWWPAPRRFLMQCPEGVLLWSPGTDTVYLYRSDKSLTPVIYQTPSLISLNPVKNLSLCLDRGQYQFFQIHTIRDGIRGGLFPTKYYMRNKKTGEVIHPKFLLPDYKGKEFILSGMGADGKVHKNEYTLELFLYELKEAYREGRLSGKLKELVATLNEDEDNDLFMLIKFK